MKNSCISFTFLSFFILLSNLLHAQYDTIKYVNGTKQAAQIIEITKKVVRFKNPKDTTGPTFTINIKYIEQFILKDGCIDLKKEGYLDCAKDPTYGVIKNENFTYNIISLDMFQLINSHLQMSYEHILKNRTFGIVGYFNQGFCKETDTATYNRIESKILGGYYKKNYAGFDFKFYPYLHKKITFWIALGAESGRSVEMITGYSTINSPVSSTKFYTTSSSTGALVLVTSPNTNYYVTSNTGNLATYFKNRLYMGYHFSSGFLLRITKHFICQGNISVGLNQFAADAGYKYGVKIGAGVLLGYAF